MDKTFKMIPYYSLLYLHLMLWILNSAELNGEVEIDTAVCNTARRCRGGGPAVRFPFRLRDHHPPHCGYPGFELSCDENKHTVMNLPKSAKLFVKKIDYESQKVEIYDPVDNCIERQLLNRSYFNVSSSPFHFSEAAVFTLYNCSLKVNGGTFREYTTCLSTNPGYGVRAVMDNMISILYLTGCSKIAVTPSLPAGSFGWYQGYTSLDWSAPNCTACQKPGTGCRIINNYNTTPATIQTECFHLPPTATGVKKKLLITGIVLGPFLIVLVAIGLFHLYLSWKVKRRNEKKIKQFMEEYKVLKSTRYSYADIKSITNHFKERLGQGAFGTVYKGKLTNNVLVAVKVLNHHATRNGDEFINEVASMGRIHHVNVARLLGFCAYGPNRALVYEFLPNESLEKFLLFESDKKNHLGWERLQDIALGIAKGLEYLHHGCEQQILHFDIKPHNILLDHNFVPKISDFGLAKLCSKEKSVVTMTAARGTMGYIAPEVASRGFGKPSYKSDVYSYGMLLLEMVGGRKNIDVNVENASQVYFPELHYTHLDQLGGQKGIEIEEEGHAKIAKKLTIVALSCVQWNPVDRPSMKVVVQMLEGDGDNLTLPPNPFASGNAKQSRPKPLNVELEIISEVE